LFDVEKWIVYGEEHLDPETNQIRRYCQHKYYTQIIWHTHPLTSKNYPSIEDIQKVLKYDKISISIIFTSWGIWQINYSGKYRLSEINPKDENVKKMGNDLHDDTSRGRIYNENAVREYRQNIQNYYPGIAVYFKTWDNIYEHKYVIRID